MISPGPINTLRIKKAPFTRQASCPGRCPIKSPSSNQHFPSDALLYQFAATYTLQCKVKADTKISCVAGHVPPYRSKPLYISTRFTASSTCKCRFRLPSVRPHSSLRSVSYTHLRAHETVLDLVCR